MSGPAAIAVDQPANFAFDGAYAAAVDKAIAKYPEGRQASAVLPLLDLAQRQHGGWVPQAAIEHIAEKLGMAKIRVMEVATFYTMINLAPVGTYHLQVCGTTPCMLRGSDEVFRAIREEIGIGHGETSDDGLFTCTEVECLGACVNAPMVQVNDDFVEDLDYENFVGMLRTLKNGGDLKTGSMAGRFSSEPEGGAQTLTDVRPPPTFDPSAIYGRVIGTDAGAGPTEPEAAPAPAPPTAPGTPAKPELSEEAVETAEDGVAETRNVDGASDAEAQLARRSETVGTEETASPEATTTSAQVSDTSTQSDSPASPVRPDALDGPRGGRADELTRIKGIGPKIEGILHSLGVYHFDQIAAWTQAERDWVNDHLQFKGRIDREKWVEQAEKLNDGGGA